MTDITYRPRPRKLGHLVLKVRDVNHSFAFYHDVVGLELSDWIDDHMVFMRAGRDHHDLALLQMTAEEIAGHGKSTSPVEHFSYQVGSVEELAEIAGMLQAREVPIDRGIGKHGPGENTFLVFKDPDGNNVEFYSDMVQVGPDAPYEPQVWDGSELATFDVWSLDRFVVAPPERIRRMRDQAVKKTPD